MISIEEAHLLIEKNISQNEIIFKKLHEAGNFFLAEDVFSPIDIPLFRQSAMDGYAVKYEDVSSQEFLFCDRIIAAGNTEHFVLKENEAIRIFTGAKVPKGADTVIMQEKTRAENGRIFFEKEKIKFGENIRPIASQNKKDELLLEKGTLLTAGALGFLASVGIEEIKVFAAPKVAILITGNELIVAGKDLHEGQVYESNSIAIKEILKKLPIGNVEILFVEDTKIDVELKINLALEQADIILITGGVSVGDYDFVHESLENIGVEKIFHKVKQKPGKPFYFGKINEQLIFGLPGNPGSVLTCMIEYVLPALKLKMGATDFLPKKIKMKSVQNIQKKDGLGVFYKAKIQGDGILLLENQESYKMNAFAKADAFIFLDEKTSEVKKDEWIEVHLF